MNHSRDPSSRKKDYFAQKFSKVRAYQYIERGMNKPELDNDRLFRRFLELNDLAAFEKLYDRYKGGLLGYVRLLTGDRQVAEDIVQDVFVKLLESPDLYKFRNRLKSYLFTAVRNRAFDLIRRRKRWQERKAKYEIEFESRGQPNKESEFTAEQISDAICGLPRDQATVLVLRIYAGLPFSEIADLEGAVENTVVSRYRYALAKMRHILEGLKDDG